MHISVDADKCIGAGQCVRVAPDLFAQGEDDGLVVLLNDSAPPDRESVALDAERLCPARAIVATANGAVGDAT